MLRVEALPLSELRRRSSEKWREYPEDVLPLFVAETDFPLAPAVAEALRQAVETGDTGYVASRTPLAASYAAFAKRRFGWEPDPARMRSTADVSMGIVEILRRVVRPGERVVVTPPVYPPFYDLVEEAGAEVERVPLRDTGTGWELDLEGIRDAFAGGSGRSCSATRTTRRAPFTTALSSPLSPVSPTSTVRRSSRTRSMLRSPSRAPATRRSSPSARPRSASATRSSAPARPSTWQD